VEGTTSSANGMRLSDNATKTSGNATRVSGNATKASGSATKASANATRLSANASDSGIRSDMSASPGKSGSLGPALTEGSAPIISELLRPNIRLFGEVDDKMLDIFLKGLDEVLHSESPLILELSTSGGDAEVGRRIALDAKLCAEHYKRKTVFFGKTNVYSAGVTIMSGFPREERYLSRDCVLLIHERRLDKNVHLYGPLQSNVQIAKEILNQLETGIALELDAFRDLIEGSALSLEEIRDRAQHNWYLKADEARQYGLIAAVI
jgi:ATP-dependent protease ClpP protease subunit